MLKVIFQKSWLSSLSTKCLWKSVLILFFFDNALCLLHDVMPIGWQVFYALRVISKPYE